ncbi:MAG: EamA family transporter [Chloroflexaceae bacterium]|nr:EamA family transporter [Chloroflexaceae bacterium]
MTSLPPFRQMLQRLQHLPSLGYLWLGALIFGASNPVTKRIIEIGDRNFIEGENPVSFCNVFFAGNVCALLSLSLIYRNKLKLSSFRALSSRDWLGIFSVAILSGVLAPAIYYEALARTAAVKVILLGRLDTPLVLLLSVIF